MARRRNATRSVEPKPVNATRQVLITYISYDQDDYDFKKSDLTFMYSHKKALCEKGYLTQDELTKLPEAEIRQRTDEVGIDNILCRHDIWRPTIALSLGYEPSKVDPTKFPAIHFDTIYLLYNKTDNPKRAKIAQEVLGDLKEISATNHFELIPIQHDFESPFCQAEVYQYFYKLFQDPRFHEPGTDYYVNVGSGTNAIKTSLFLLTHDRQIIAKRILPHPWGESHKDYRHYRGWYQIDDPADFDAIYSAVRQSRLGDTVSKINTGIETRNEEFQKLLSEIKTVSRVTRNPILLTGASGSGKTQIAKNIFEILKEEKLVKADRFQHLNCATLRGDANITKSALFGHVRGSHSTADSDRKGALELADGGILFLDEIGTLGLDEQAMLLTAIEEKQFLPLGGSKYIRSDFRLICGTNTNLWEAVESGSFRRDLFERINLWHFQLPSLKDRISEITHQCQLFLQVIYPKKTGKLIQFQDKTVADEFERFITDEPYDWPGNFRELNAIMVRMCEMATLSSNRITQEILKDEINRTRGLRKMANRVHSHPKELPSRAREDVPNIASINANNNDLHPDECIRLVGEDIYKTLSQLQISELKLLIKTIKDHRITDQKQLCREVYGNKLTQSGLTRRLRSEFNLSFSHGKLSRIED